MAVRIRLRRVGSKKNPIWRIVVADKRSPRDGRTIETIGRYDPQTEPSTIEVDEERARHWLEHGAQPSETSRDGSQICVAVIASHALRLPSKVNTARIRPAGTLNSRNE